MAHIRRSTDLLIPAERAWAAVRQTRSLDHVAWPLQRFERLDPPSWPGVWVDGRYRVRCRMFGFIPVGEQWINISTVEAGPACYVLRDNGHGDLASRWDHRITIRPLSGDRCRYTDEVEVRAGLLTPLVAAFAWAFYRHRQRRWRSLVASGFAPLASGAAT